MAFLAAPSLPCSGISPRRSNLSRCTSSASGANADANGNDADADTRGSKISAALRGRRLSPERRRKISEALKGRRLSETHRLKLSARFTGAHNPRYGCVLSASQRAAISAGMASARARRRNGMSRGTMEGEKEAGVEKEKGNVEQEQELEDTGCASGANGASLKALREKALSSRLLSGERGCTPNARARTEREEKRVADVLRRVRAGTAPPVSVRKCREKVVNARVRENELCTECRGTGFCQCPGCVSAFGVVSQKCAVCMGAGAVFCKRCMGRGDRNAERNAKACSVAASSGNAAAPRSANN